jgi:hypothetical protein
MWVWGGGSAYSAHHACLSNLFLSLRPLILKLVSDGRGGGPQIRSSLSSGSFSIHYKVLDLFLAELEPVIVKSLINLFFFF